jgi:putative tricarboxylic transport membrane protein
MDFNLELFGPLFLHTLGYWWVIIPSILLGMVIGAIPGFSAANTIIILLPLTLAMEVEIGLIFMVALYCSSRMGAGIPAILVNIPGTAGAAATPLDGYPMTRSGRGQQALAMSFVASTAGGLLTTVLALLAMPWLAEVSFYMHSVEMIVVMLFGISLIATIAAKDTLKGLIAGFFGLMIGSIGADHVYATPRGTMGFLELYDGIPLIPALVGLFAVSEAFLMIEGESLLSQHGKDLIRRSGWAATIEGARIAVKRWWHICWNVRRLPAVQNLLQNTRALRHRPRGRTHRAGVRQQRRHFRNFDPAPYSRHPRRRDGGGHAGRHAVSGSGFGAEPVR